MALWIYRVKIKHLFTEKEDHTSVQKCMNAIASVLKEQHCFSGFGELHKFHNIPQGDDVFGPVDYANKLLARLFDYADRRRIWIE